MSKVALPGLVVACIVSGLGLFVGPGLSSPLLFPWVLAYLFLALRVSYDAYVVPAPLKPFPFIVLGIVLLNFLVQVTGGVTSSVWPAYFLYAVVVSAFSPPRRAYGMVAVILAIESSNLLLTGQTIAGRWHVYAGFGLSLAGVSAAVSHIMYRIRSEADQARAAVKQMEDKADAVDPLTEPAKLEALMPQSRQAANLRTARDREEKFADLLDMMFLIIPVHAYVLLVKERREGTEMFVLRACRTESISEVIPLGTALDPAAGKTGIDLCAERFKSHYLPELSEDSVSFLGYYGRAVKNSPVRSAMIIPILSKDGDNVVAVLAADKITTDSFSEETQERLKRFSGFFLEVIENTQMSLDLETKAAHFGALHDISTSLNSSLRFREIMAKVVPRIRTVVPFDFCACLLKTENDGKTLLELTLLDGYDREMTGRTFAIEESAVINHHYQDWQNRAPHDQSRDTTVHYDRDCGDRGREIGLFPFKELQQPIRSLYTKLLVPNEKFIGVFIMASLRHDAFSEYHRFHLLDTLMNQIGQVADNSLLHQQIESMAKTDGLTGLLNHRTFMERLHEKYRELERTPRPFSILLMDIDRFKLVNDKYGHPVGDVAIKAVAKVLRDTVRSADFVARHGGEEFAVGMVETDTRGAVQMAERVRSLMEKTVITRVHDGELRCTLSIGVVSFPQDTGNIADLVSLADEALYHAKRSGRNRVSLYRDSVKNPAAPVQS